MAIYQSALGKDLPHIHAHTRVLQECFPDHLKLCIHIVKLAKTRNVKTITHIIAKTILSQKSKNRGNNKRKSPSQQV